MRIWDGAYTSYAEWATFDRQLDKVVSDAQKAQAEGRSDEAARDHYSLVFCQIVDAELDSDTDAEVLAAWAVEDDDAEDYSILRPLSLILRPPIRYSVTYKLD